MVHGIVFKKISMWEDSPCKNCEKKLNNWVNRDPPKAVVECSKAEGCLPLLDYRKFDGADFEIHTNDERII